MSPRKAAQEPAARTEPESLPIDDYISSTMARAQIDRIVDAFMDDIEKIINAHSTVPGAAATVSQHINAVRQLAKDSINK